ncbi:MAG: hypothetical protein HamCj_11220 [Candidatus Hamiltonella defensa (Ceratovacuna japonica)]
MINNGIWYYPIILFFISKSFAKEIDIKVPTSIQSHIHFNESDLLEIKKYQKMAYEVVLNMPNIIEMASSYIKKNIKKKFNIDINPNKTYLNRFKSASNNHDTITGWEHCGDLTKSETLTQTVLTNFSAFNHENPDFLDDYVGVYKEGAGAQCYDHRNEVRIRPSELMNLLWDINFSKIYETALTDYWTKYENQYRIVAKANFIARLVKQYSTNDLSEEGYHLSLKLVDNLAYKYQPNTDYFVPLSISDLTYDNFSNHQYDIFPFKIKDYISTDILIIINKNKTKYILYIPNNIIELQKKSKKNYKENAFLEFNNLEEIKTWIKIQSLDENKKNKLLSHFSLNDRQKGLFHKSVTEIIEKGIWDDQYIKYAHSNITEDAFRFLTKQQKMRMEKDADTQIKSNAEIRWDTALLNISALSTVLLPLQLIQPELGLIVNSSLWLTEIGINVEKSFNADSFEERKAAFNQALSSSINGVVNILFFYAFSQTSESLETGLQKESPIDHIAPSGPPKKQTLALVSNKPSDILTDMKSIHIGDHLFYINKYSDKNGHYQLYKINADKKIQQTSQFVILNKNGEWVKLALKGGGPAFTKIKSETRNINPYEGKSDQLKDKTKNIQKPIKNRKQFIVDEKPVLSENFSNIQLNTVPLPELPSINLSAKPIPKKIHYIWLGDKNIPEELIKNMTRNTWNTSDYQSIVHISASLPSTFHNVKNQLRGILNLSVSNLENESFFNQFKKTLSGKQFQAFLKEPAKNYSAASDVLRYWIIDEYGGIYLDTDDMIPNDVSKIILIAGPKDILLNLQVEHHSTNFKGYNTSNFASHPDNPVLKKIIKEMEKRYSENKIFYTEERPYLKKDNNGNETNKDLVNDYMKKIFHQVGPQLFNDVLKEEIKYYYHLSDSMRLISIMDPLPKNWKLYQTEINKAVDYYLPFYRKFKIEIGNEHSWNYTR